MAKSPKRPPSRPTDAAKTPPQVADPSAIARRVESIAEVVQLFGAFNRFPAPPGVTEELLTAHFAPPRAEAALTAPNELAVSLEFRFAASRTGDCPTPRSLNSLRMLRLHPASA